MERGRKELGGMTKAVASGSDPKLRIERKPPPKPSGRYRPGVTRLIVGVNKYRKDKEDPIRHS